MAEDAAPDAVPPPPPVVLEHAATLHEPTIVARSRKSTLEVSMFDLAGNTSTAPSTVGHVTNKGPHHPVEFDEYFVSFRVSWCCIFWSTG
jgi:hypothetical protein